MSQIPVASYVYRAKLIAVTDGDTIVIERDLGDHLYQQTAVRLLGLNCPELHGETKAAGEEAAAFTRAWLAAGSTPGGWSLIIETHLNKREKYGRLLARVWRVSDGALLNDALLASDHAVPYMVGTP